METTKENIAVENVTFNTSKQYNAENLINYSIALSLLKEHKAFYKDDYEKAKEIVTKNHGLKLSSIYAPNDLI